MTQLSPSAVLIRLENMIQTGTVRTLGPWRALLMPDDSSPSEELQVALLVTLALKSNLELPEKVLVYIEFRCRWLKNRDLFVKELELPQVAPFLDKVDAALSHQRALYKGFKEEETLSKTRSSTSGFLETPADLDWKEVVGEGALQVVDALESFLSL